MRSSTKYSVLAALVAGIFSSCSSNEDNQIQEVSSNQDEYKQALAMASGTAPEKFFPYGERIVNAVKASWENEILFFDPESMKARAALSPKVEGDELAIFKLLAKRPDDIRLGRLNGSKEFVAKANYDLNDGGELRDFSDLSDPFSKQFSARNEFNEKMLVNTVIGFQKAIGLGEGGDDEEFRIPLYESDKSSLSQEQRESLIGVLEFLNWDGTNDKPDIRGIVNSRLKASGDDKYFKIDIEGINERLRKGEKVDLVSKVGGGSSRDDINCMLYFVGGLLNPQDDKRVVGHREKLYGVANDVFDDFVSPDMRGILKDSFSAPIVSGKVKLPSMDELERFLNSVPEEERDSFYESFAGSLRASYEKASELKSVLNERGIKLGIEDILNSGEKAIVTGVEGWNVDLLNYVNNRYGEMLAKNPSFDFAIVPLPRRIAGLYLLPNKALEDAGILGFVGVQNFYSGSMGVYDGEEWVYTGNIGDGRPEFIGAVVEAYNKSE